MLRYKLCPGQRIRLAGNVYVLLTPKFKTWELQNETTGEVLRHPEASLLRMYSDEEMAFAPGSTVPGERSPMLPGSSADLRPLQIVDVSMKVIEGVVVVDDWTLIPLKDPQIVIAVDRRTAAVVGENIGVGTRVTMGTIKNAISPKSRLTEQFPDLKYQWACYGLPETVVLTHKDCESPELEHAAAQLGFRIEFNRAGRSIQGAGEGILDGFNRALLYACWDNAKNGTISPVTLSMVKRLAMKYIVDLWMQTSEWGVISSPAMRWQNATADCAPELPANVAELNVAFRSTVVRKFKHDRIHLHGLLYRSDRLADLYRYLGPGMAEVTVAYDPENLGYIYAFNPELQDYFRADAVDKEYADGLPLWKHEAITGWVGNRRARDINLAALGATIREDLLRSARNRTSTRTTALITSMCDPIDKRHRIN